MVHWCRVALSGSLYSSSERYPGLPPDRLDILKRTMPAHGLLPTRPVDLFENSEPRLWLLTDARGAGQRAVIGLFNWDESRPLAVDCPLARAGLAADTRYVGFDFWANQFLAAFSGRLACEVPAGSCRVLSLRPEAPHPQVISTSRHVTQGIWDLLGETWDREKAVLSGASRVVEGDLYELRIAVPTGASSWEAVSGEADGPLRIEQTGARIRARFTPAKTGEVRWQLRFKPATVTVDHQKTQGMLGPMKEAEAAKEQKP